MRKTAYILISILCAAAITSCYQDKSTYATKDIAEIYISCPDSTLTVYYGETLELAPAVTEEGRTAEDFTYQWNMDITPGSTANRLDLGTEPSLEYTVMNSPSTTPYSLSLTITDKINAYTKTFVWTVYVNNSLGEGLIVAHTRDNGTTSNLDLVSDVPITYGYTSASPRYTRNIYSLANGSSIDGPVQALSSRMASDGKVFNESRILIGTGKHLFALDPLTYKIASKDAQLFNFIEADVFNTTCIFNFADYICGTVVNGILYVTVANGTNTYSKLAYNVSSNNTVLPSNIAYGKPDQGVITHFNPTEHKFYSIHGWASMTGGLSEDFPTAISFKLSNAECVAAGATRNACLAFIMKTTDGSYHILVQDPSLSIDSFTEFDLTAPEIDKAVSFAFCDNCDVIYYATESTVYAIIMSGGKTTVRKLNWAPDDSEEKISIIQQYQQAWWGTQQLSYQGYDFTLPYHRLQIIIATYDESKGEGKIYLRPFNVSTGLFTFKSNGTYDGFGKIESITTSFR